MTQPQSHPGLVITIKYSLGFNYQPNKIIIDKNSQITPITAESASPYNLKNN